MRVSRNKMAHVKSFYLTTPIYYVNDAPHIGHAYTTVAGDVLTRWHRQRGESVWFLTGTDEHGQKVMRTAEQNSAAPQDWVDRLVAEAWKPNWSALNIANDDFIRTTEPRHTERVQKFLQSLKDSGHIYAGKYVEEAIRREFAYIFAEDKYPGIPLINLHAIENKPFQLLGKTIIPIEVSHYKLPVLGFRIDDFAYITDAKTISEKEAEKLSGVHTLVINALRREAHNSHFTLDEALFFIKKVKPKQAYLTHLSHQMGLHGETEAELPPGVNIAYDGLKISL